MTVTRNFVDSSRFNSAIDLPYSLRLSDFQSAMQDVYDFFFDVNRNLVERSLERMDDMLRPAMLSGMISDMLTASLAKHSRALVANAYFNGHPDLIVRGHYPGDSVKSGERGIEVKSTSKRGGAVDTHGARPQWMAVFVYVVDKRTEPAIDRKPLSFSEVYLGQVTVEDFRKNARGELGTRTATLHAAGLAKLRENWVYRVTASTKRKSGKFRDGLLS